MANHGIQITSSSQMHVNAGSPAYPSCLCFPTANGKGWVLAEANSAHPKTSAKPRWYEMTVWKRHSLCRPQGKREVQTSDTNPPSFSQTEAFHLPFWVRPLLHSTSSTQMQQGRATIKLRAVRDTSENTSHVPHMQAPHFKIPPDPQRRNLMAAVAAHMH